MFSYQKLVYATRYQEKQLPCWIVDKTCILNCSILKTQWVWKTSNLVFSRKNTPDLEAVGVFDRKYCAPQKYNRFSTFSSSRWSWDDWHIFVRWPSTLYKREIVNCQQFTSNGFQKIPRSGFRISTSMWSLQVCKNATKTHEKHTCSLWIKKCLIMLYYAGLFNQFQFIDYKVQLQCHCHFRWSDSIFFW